jgi:hypothetical protein
MFNDVYSLLICLSIYVRIYECICKCRPTYDCPEKLKNFQMRYKAKIGRLMEGPSKPKEKIRNPEYLTPGYEMGHGILFCTFVQLI